MNAYHDQFMIQAVTAPESKGLGGDEPDDKFDALIASHDAMGLLLDKLERLFEYSGKYAPLKTASFATEPVVQALSYDI